jgi:hypothetical protein
MNEPTREQIQKFWEWCGFKQKREYHDNGKSYYEYWVCQDYEEFELPTIDLNNLFRWAVPEAMECNSNFIDLQIRRYIAPGYDDLLTSYMCEIWSDNGQGSIVRQAGLPELALFWAIWEVLKCKTA